MKIYIKRIEKGEELMIEDAAVEALIYISDGDLRKLTNTLQSAALQNKTITEQSIYNVAARARPKEIVAMLNFAVTSKFDLARGELDNLILRHGMNAEDILTQCYREAQSLEYPGADQARDNAGIGGLQLQDSRRCQREDPDGGDAGQHSSPEPEEVSRWAGCSCWPHFSWFFQYPQSPYTHQQPSPFRGISGPLLFPL